MSEKCGICLVTEMVCPACERFISAASHEAEVARLREQFRWRDALKEPPTELPIFAIDFKSETKFGRIIEANEPSERDLTPVQIVHRGLFTHWLPLRGTAVAPS